MTRAIFATRVQARNEPLASGVRKGLSVCCALAITLLVVGRASQAPAASDCQPVFEAWTKLSERQIRVRRQSQNSGSYPSSACIPSEDVRAELLVELARTRARCAEVVSSFDQSPQRIKTLLDINENFIAALAICRADRREPLGDWTTKATAAASDGKSPPISGPCLQISRVKQEHYALVNRHCTGKTVLVVIETRGTSGRIRCKTYTMGQSLSVRTSGDAPPRIHHECVLNQGRCTTPHLDDMFPECGS